MEVSHMRTWGVLIHTLAMAFSEYCPSLHFTSCYNLLNFLRSIFTATWVFFSASVNLMLRACSCASVLSLRQVFFSQWSDFLMTSTSCICWSYIPCRGMVFHNFFFPFLFLITVCLLLPEALLQQFISGDHLPNVFVDAPCFILDHGSETH